MDAREEMWAGARDRATWENQAARAAVAAERDRLTRALEADPVSMVSAGPWDAGFEAGSARMRARVLAVLRGECG